MSGAQGTGLPPGLGQGRRSGGGDLLELRLTDGEHFATVLEQHGPARHGPPVNVLTGHPAAADGFRPATFQGLGLPGPGPGPGPPPPAAAALWINTDAPFRPSTRRPPPHSPTSPTSLPSRRTTALRPSCVPARRPGGDPGQGGGQPRNRGRSRRGHRPDGAGTGPDPGASGTVTGTVPADRRRPASCGTAESSQLRQ